MSKNTPSTGSPAKAKLSPSAAHYKKLDAAKVAQAITLGRTGVTNADLAAAMGVHPASFYRWLADGKGESERRHLGQPADPELDLTCDLYEGLRGVQAEIVAMLSGSWLQAARTDWRAAEALLKTRFMHWRPSGIDGAAEGAGTVDDHATLANESLSAAQARALVGAMRQFGDALLAAVEAEGVEGARSQMGQLASAALGG